MATKQPTIEAARLAKDEAKRRLAKVPGVVGVGLTKLQGSYAVKINVASSGSPLPSKFGDVPVVVEVVGQIKKR